VCRRPFWREANAAAERHAEVPYAIRQVDASGLLTVVRGVIDLVYRPGDGWRILDYKTDQVSDGSVLAARYSSEIEQYADAWSGITATKPTGALYSVRLGQVFTAVGPGEDRSLADS